MKRVTPALSVLPAFLIAFALPVSGQNPYEQQVLGILSEVSGFAVERGYSQTGDKFVGALNEDEGESHYVELAAGMDYVIVAVCDQDCADIDLHLFSPGEDLVGQDTEPDKMPVIELGNVGGGTHRLDVGMHNCSNQPCYYAVGVYVKRGSGGPPQGGGQVAGGDAYVEQVRTILERWSAGVAAEGYVATGDEWVSGLGSGESEEHHVTLGGGADYVFMAVCDEDCGDMDMALFDPAGNLVSEDLEDDANPVVSVSGAVGGEYTVQVRVLQCSQEPCYYALGLFKRTREDG